MISLTDRQLQTVMTAAQPLDPSKRIVFVERVAALLQRSSNFTDDDLVAACGRALRGLVHETAA